jgi:hypothetical protein
VRNALFLKRLFSIGFFTIAGAPTTKTKGRKPHEKMRTHLDLFRPALSIDRLRRWHGIGQFLIQLFFEQ